MIRQLRRSRGGFRCSVQALDTAFIAGLPGLIGLMASLCFARAVVRVV